MPLYRHTQFGSSLVVFTLVIWLIVFAMSLGHPPSWQFITTSLLLFAIGFVFATMTITVSSDRVEWCFTMGLFRQTILRRSIMDASVIKISFLNGLGIRTNNFRDYLWSVGGSSAIRLELDNGRFIALSTDDPDGLMSALQRD
jgi:hypothetical protein